MVIIGRIEKDVTICISDYDPVMCGGSCQFLEAREAVNRCPWCELFGKYLRDTGEKDRDDVKIAYRHDECVRKFGNGGE